MTEYQVQTTHVPPVLRLVDGVLHVEVIFGSQTFRAPVGDGRYFFSQLVEKLVDPALAAAHNRQVQFPRDEERVADAGWLQNFLNPAFASPND